MYQHPIWKLVPVPTTPILFQFPTNGLGKAEEDGPDAWAPATHMGDSDEALDPWL